MTNKGSGGLQSWQVKAIRARLLDDAKKPKLLELAEICGISMRHLTRAFKRTTGETIGKEVDKIMVYHAKSMLEEGCSVCNVALALGYATSGSFSNAFRRATGLLPSEVNPEAKSRTPPPN